MEKSNFVKLLMGIGVCIAIVVASNGQNTLLADDTAAQDQISEMVTDYVAVDLRVTYLSWKLDSGGFGWGTEPASSSGYTLTLEQELEFAYQAKRTLDEFIPKAMVLHRQFGCIKGLLLNREPLTFYLIINTSQDKSDSSITCTDDKYAEVARALWEGIVDPEDIYWDSETDSLKFVLPPGITLEELATGYMETASPQAASEIDRAIPEHNQEQHWISDVNQTDPLLIYEEDESAPVLGTTEEQLAAMRKHYEKVKFVKGMAWDDRMQLAYFIVDSENTSSDVPFIDIDDFIMALKLIYSNDDPALSIEPASGGNYNKVLYYPSRLAGTHLGWIFYKADYTLKAITFGQDPNYGHHVHAHIKGFRGLGELAQQDGDLQTGYYGRIWIEPERVPVGTGEKNVYKLNDMVMGVESESRYNAPNVFAKHFEDNYRAFANEFPIYWELNRAGKFIACARWLKDRHYSYGLPLSQIDVEHYSTPSSVPMVEQVIGKESWTSGMTIYTRKYYIAGGVDMSTGNSYYTGERAHLNGMHIDDVEPIMYTARPYPGAMYWEFEVNSHTYAAILIPH